MKKNGIVFDIKEFAINDGPGIRLTIFMKGCPLRCEWCHNPEGLLFSPQYNYKTDKIVGKEYSVKELVDKIYKYKDVFELSGGGVTFSGGEPTFQSEFIYEVASQLQDIHKTLDTSGFCEEDVFRKLLNVFELVYFDLKIIDNDLHKKYTGVFNDRILKNLKILDESQIPYHVRIPLIPNITDTYENLNKIKNIILGLKNKPLRVDPLPYNILAGGKYSSYGMKYLLMDVISHNNDEIIFSFKQDLIKNNIKIIGDEVKCLQKN